MRGPSQVEDVAPAERTAESDGHAPRPELSDRTQFAALACVLVTALAVRVWDLAEVPNGLHGDEAATGLEARRILDDGWIGVYSLGATGQPVIPFYVTAVSVWILGSTPVAVRIVAALVGVATVALLFFVARRRLGSRVGLTAAGLLAVMPWHLHFSRLGFGVIWWPLVVLVGLAAMARATEEPADRAWFLTGAAAAAGIYIYNAHWMAGATFGLFFIVWMARQTAVPWAVRSKWTAMFGLGGIIVAWPMFRYIVDDQNDYTRHFNTVDRRQSPEWVEASFSGKMKVGIEWYFDAWNNLLFNHIVDGTDAAGVIAPVASLVVLAFLIGIVVLVLRHRSHFTGLVLLMLATLPLGSALTIDAQLRRNFAMAPLVALAAAVGIAWIFEQFWQFHRVTSIVTAITLAAFLVVTAAASYFGDFADSFEENFVFAPELADTVDLVRAAERAEDDIEVYFLSPRHSFAYEVLQFQLDGVDGVDRSDEFGADPGLDTTDSPGGTPLFILVGPYHDRLPELRAMYPGGIETTRNGEPPVTSYLVLEPASDGS